MGVRLWGMVHKKVRGQCMCVCVAVVHLYLSTVLSDFVCVFMSNKCLCVCVHSFLH